MFKMQILTQTENRKWRKSVATDKKCILWKMYLKFPNPKSNPIGIIAYIFI